MSDTSTVHSLRVENERLREALRELIEAAESAAQSANIGTMDDAIANALAVIKDTPHVD